MSDDMISRADAIAILEDEMPGHYLSKKTQIVTKLRALPAVEVGASATPAQDVVGIGEAALENLLDRRGLREPLSAIKFEDPEVWREICEATGAAALARMTEASPRPINWRDDQEAVVEDDEPMIGRDYE